MNHNKRGEIATLLTLGLVLVGTLITLGISLFVSNKKTNLASNSKAESRCSWGDWDCAASGANNDIGRICGKMGKGFCSPGNCQAEEGTGDVCVPNKWDGRGGWGCWGAAIQVCASQTPPSPVPGTPDSSSAPGNACGLTRSQYGTCPDWAAENSCHQRLDPPGDPDFGLWFKCVNRWWNGPCDSKEVCEGSVAEPPAEAPAVDTSTVAPVSSGGLAIRNGNCYNYDNCKDKCVSNAVGRGENDANDWYCSDKIEGTNINNETGQYCCYPGISDLVSLTPIPAPGTLDGACLTRPGRSDLIIKYCLSGFTCNADNICVESTSGSTIPTPVTGTVTPIPILTQAFIVEGTCNASGTSIGFGSCSYFEQNGSQDCSNSTPVYNSNGCVIYRVCGGTDCKYDCYENGNHKNCLGADDPQTNYGYIRIINSSTKDIIIGKIIIEKKRLLGSDPNRDLGGDTLSPGETKVINLNTIGEPLYCSSLNPIDVIWVYLLNSDGSLLISGSDGCWSGVKILINLTE